MYIYVWYQFFITKIHLIDFCGKQLVRVYKVIPYIIALFDTYHAE